MSCNGNCNQGDSCTCADASTSEQATKPLYITGYRSGWRWGVLDGLLCGCLLTTVALMSGSQWWALQ